MPGSLTLLLSDRGRYWGSYLEGLEAEVSAVVDLDPGSGERKAAGRCELREGGKATDWAFIGHTDFRRHPLNWWDAMQRLVRHDDAVVILPCYPWSPGVRDFMISSIQHLQPGRIVVPEGAPHADFAWPLDCEKVAVEDELPREAKDAQRNARWSDLMSHAQVAELDLDAVQTVGSRIGFGERVSATRHPWVDAIGEAVYLQPPVLFALTSREPDPDRVGEALSATGCEKFVSVAPERYAGLLCAPCDLAGRELGFGVIDHLDISTMRVGIRTTAHDPSYAKILKLGSLWLGAHGDPYEGAKLWSY